MRKTIFVLIIYLLFGFLYLLTRPVLGGCDAEKPDHAPDLFQINVTKNTATLHFTPVNNAVTHYWIAYGLARGEDRYGISYLSGRNDGVINYTVNYLTSNTKYYFRVKAVNGCRQGFWSETMSVETNWENKIYTRFKDSQPNNNYYNKTVISIVPEILGEATQEAELALTPKPTLFPTTTTNANKVKEVSTNNLPKYIFSAILLFLLIQLILYFYKKKRE